MKLEILLVFVLFRFNLAVDSESLEPSPEDISVTEEGSGLEDEELSNEEFNAKSVEERLFENVELGNIEAVQATINSEVDLNLKNHENETVFQIATRLKDIYENISHPDCFESDGRQCKPAFGIIQLLLGPKLSWVNRVTSCICIWLCSISP